MKTPYSKMTIERLQRSVSNHLQSLTEKQVDYHDAILFKAEPEYIAKCRARMQREKSRLKQAKLYLQKRTDERDMKNH